MDWSLKANSFQIACSTFNHNLENSIHIIQKPVVGEDGPQPGTGNQLISVASSAHQYPVTKLLFCPQTTQQTPGGGGGGIPELLATTGDYFRVWECVAADTGNDQILICRATLQNVRRVGQNQQELFAPLTSFDWNFTDASVIVTSSVDTTCTVWDMNTQQAKTQLIAHDSEVLDVAFAQGVHIFASVGADGSLRMFDQRQLANSTIMYETASATKGTFPPSLLRLDWNKKDPNYVAVVQQDSSAVVVLDIRVPAVPVFELGNGHVAAISSVTWAPHSSTHLCSGGDDGNVLIWDIAGAVSSRGGGVLPIKQIQKSNPVANISWSSVNPAWVAIASENSVEVAMMNKN